MQADNDPQSNPNPEDAYSLEDIRAPREEIAGEPPPAPLGEALARPAEKVMVALDDLVERFSGMEDQFAEFHRRSAHRELVIDRLHEENQQLRRGVSKAILDPVIADLIRLYDQLAREVRRLEAEGRDERLLWSFADDVAQILDRCGIEIYTAQPGDHFDRDRHRPLAVVACMDESRTTRWRK